MCTVSAYRLIGRQWLKQFIVYNFKTRQSAEDFCSVKNPEDEIPEPGDIRYFVEEDMICE